MKALRYRLACWGRTRRGAVASLTAVVAVVAAVVLTLAAGARRTESAPDRYTAAFGGDPSARATQDSGPPRDREIAALPGVASVDALTFVFGGVVGPRTAEPLDALVFSGSYLAAGARVVQGRAPAPNSPTDVVVTESMPRAAGLRLGDRLDLLAISQEDAASHGFDPQYARLAGSGVIVGTFDSASELDDPTPIVVFPRSLIDDDRGGRVGVSGTEMRVTLEPGVDVAAFRAAVAAGLANPQQVSVLPARLVSAETRTAVRGHAIGLWLLAAIGGLAAIAAVGQVLARTVRLTSDEAAALRALGYSHGQLVGDATARAAIPAVVGATAAVGIAAAASGIFPFGFVRRLEPDAGVRIELTILTLGWIALVAGMVAWVACASLTRERPTVTRRIGGVDLLAARCPTAACATGVRFGLGSRARGAGLVGAAVLVAAVIASLTFAVSERRLVRDPDRYGATADFLVDNGAEVISPPLLEVLLSDPAVAAVTLYGSTSALAPDSSTIPVFGGDNARGAVDPYVLDGRLPIAADEIALGRRSSRGIGVSIGERLDLVVGDRRAEYVVTGLVIPPSIRGNDVVGNGAVVTRAGLARIAPEAVPHAAAVDLVPGIPPEAAVRILESSGITVDEDPLQRLPAIANIARITFVPFVLAGLLAALAALVVVNGLFTGVRRRDAQVGVLRALGADARWIVRATAWQALASTVVPIMIGWPLGLVIGRFVYVAFATRLATATDVAVPLAPAGIVSAALVGFGAAVALGAGRRARKAAPASLLRAPG